MGLAEAGGRSRVTIVGAGAVGSTIAYALMMRGLAHEIVLTDAVPHKAEAEAKDLMHGSMFAPAVEITAGTLEDAAGSGLIIITAGAKQKPGQSRLQLAEGNVEMLRGMVPRILDAAPDAILLIVSNPVDVLTEAALEFSGLPPARVFGSGTVLDTSRFRSLLARRLNVSVANIHAYIVGEHGESEVLLWSSAQIANVPLERFRPPGRPPLDESDRRAIFHGVRDAAAQVIAAKGMTNWAVGLAVARIVEAVYRNEQAVLTVSRRLDDFCGVSGVSLSVPRLVGAAGAGPALELTLDERELKLFRNSAAVLEEAGRRLGLGRPAGKITPSRSFSSE
jgi:L-lactate dehydrogenase